MFNIFKTKIADVLVSFAGEVKALGRDINHEPVLETVEEGTVSEDSAIVPSAWDKKNECDFNYQLFVEGDYCYYAIMDYVTFGFKKENHYSKIVVKFPVNDESKSLLADTPNRISALWDIYQSFLNDDNKIAHVENAIVENIGANSVTINGVTVTGDNCYLISDGKYMF